MAKSAKNDTQETSFLSMVSSLVTVIDKPAPSNKLTPTERMRVKFVEHIDEQLKLIDADAQNSRWFKKTSEGFVLTLRNGNTVMSINGQSYFKAPDADKAKAFFNAAQQAAKSGEFDQVLEATQRTKSEA